MVKWFEQKSEQHEREEGQMTPIILTMGIHNNP
jgi:hypothetical protein